ncbi:crocetin glucosyltransferase, chloroplastic-like [Abrus precatorius]|uniref:Glycosyltransferase n=1 Tax=Abrus precatorius TaxID=3816 RepID=A0A8B8KJU7_ABRPR|nr:crocetin glucosyltransferase, chloroplastic-like [Abrus precatorius]
MHFLLIIFPAHGHINPALQFAKRLIAMGAHVTIPITLHMQRRVTNKITIPGLSFLPFSDGFDAGYTPVDDEAGYMFYMSELERHGSEFVTSLIVSSADEGRPFTCLTYTLLVPWAPKVARGFNLPSAMLWIEPATVLDIFYYYFHGYADCINDKTKEDSLCSMALPGLPFLLSAHDIPSFLLVWKSSVFSYVLRSFEEQIQQLDLEAKPTVLVNTFEALEAEALRAVDGFNMIPIGPLLPSAFVDGKDPSDTSFGGDLFPVSDDCVEWLNSKPEKSVVYVSFGSYFELSRMQMEEIARALLDCGSPFVWVLREKEKADKLSCGEELRKRGKIVTWCSQVEVLAHGSVGCFLTHCGWNSTVESLVCGVPMVAFPQWMDQKTSAKLIEDVWKVGVRVDLLVNEEGTVEGKEIKECLKVVMESGEKGNELRMNAKKWKGLAREAAKEGGSSEKNLRAFMDGVGQKFQKSKFHPLLRSSLQQPLAHSELVLL